MYIGKSDSAIRSQIWTKFLVRENDAMIQVQTNALQVRLEIYTSERRSNICLRLFFNAAAAYNLAADDLSPVARGSF